MWQQLLSIHAGKLFAEAFIQTWTFFEWARSTFFDGSLEFDRIISRYIDHMWDTIALVIINWDVNSWPYIPWQNFLHMTSENKLFHLIWRP